MFTGIVEEVGRVRHVERVGDGCRLTIEADIVTSDLSVGDSIALDGVCQTVVACDDAAFTVEAIATTLSRSTLGSLRTGDAVNLERPLEVGARLGGHFIQGHSDGTGRVVAIEPVGEHVLLDLEVPEAVADVTLLHGSIAVHGVSLTVNALPSERRVQVALIPHTWQHTSLRQLRVGDRVNVEGDVIGKYVARLMARQPTG